MPGINSSPWAGNVGPPAECPWAVSRSISARLMPDIAIVILNFNGRSLLDECLSSLSRLTIPAEIVVADNGSTDNSLAYLRERHASIRLLNLEKNWGFAEGY